MQENGENILQIQIKEQKNTEFAKKCKNACICQKKAVTLHAELQR